MDPGHLTHPQAVQGYLAELDAALPLARSARRQIVDEIADGLACAVEARTAAGCPAAAATEAVAEFGNPRDLARDLLRQIAASRARRTGIGLISTGPLVGTVWVVALGGSGGALERINRTLGTVSPLVAILLVAVPCAVLAVAAAGRRAAVLPATTGVYAALCALLACVAGDVVLVASALADIRAAMVVALVVSVLRLTAALAAGARLGRVHVAAR